MQSLAHVSFHEPREELLPQSFQDGKTAKPAPYAIDMQKEAIKQAVLDAAAEICGFKGPQDASESFPSQGASKIAHMRRNAGYELQDQRAWGDGQLDRVSLVSVFFVKAAGRKDLVVPVIIAHEHPEHWGERIKERIYCDFKEKHGADPEELAKPLIRKAFEHMAETIRENSKKIVLAAALAAVGLSSAFFGPGVLNDIKTGYQNWQEQRQIARDERQQTLIKELHQTVEILKDSAPNQKAVLDGLSKEHFTAVDRLRATDKESREEGLTLYGEITARHLIAGSSLGPTAAEARDRLADFVRCESEQSLRHQAADAINRIDTAGRQDQKQTRLIEEVQQAAKTLSQGAPYPKAVLNGLNTEHYRALDSALKNPSKETRKQSLTLYGQVVTHSLKVKANSSPSESAARSTLAELIARETEPALRHQAADVLAEIESAGK